MDNDQALFCGYQPFDLPDQQKADRLKGILSQEMTDLDGESLVLLASHLQAYSIPAGVKLFQEGIEEQFMLFLAQGRVRILKEDRHHGEREVGSLTEGILGEMALVENAPRSATVRTGQECLIFLLTRDAFSRMQTENPALWGILYQYIARTMSQRLRTSNEKTVNLQGKIQQRHAAPSSIPRVRRSSGKRNIVLGVLGGVLLAILVFVGFQPKTEKTTEKVVSAANLSERLNGQWQGDQPEVKEVLVSELVQPKEKKKVIKKVEKKPVQTRESYFNDVVLPKQLAEDKEGRKTIQVRVKDYSWDQLNAGGILYSIYCKKCHGSDGRGPEVPDSQSPKVDLRYSGSNILFKDAYLYWSVSEGGVPLGTTMPSFKQSLGEDQIWKLVLFMKTL